MCIYIYIYIHVYICHCSNSCLMPVECLPKGMRNMWRMVAHAAWNAAILLSAKITNSPPEKKVLEGQLLEHRIRGWEAVCCWIARQRLA